MATGNSQGSGSYYMGGSFSDPDMNWNPQDPHFLADQDNHHYTASTTAPYSQASTHYATTHTATGYSTSSQYAPAAVTWSSDYPAVASTTSGSTCPAATTTTGAGSYLTPAPTDGAHSPTYADPYSHQSGSSSAGWAATTATAGYTTPDGYDQYDGLLYDSPQDGGNRSRGFPCPVCPGKSYTRSRDLGRHMHANHPDYAGGQAPENTEYVNCPHCDKKGMRRDNMKRHIEKKHPRYVSTRHIAPREGRRGGY